MKVFTVKVMNEPGSDAVEAFHKRLAQIALDKLGADVCRKIIECAKEK